MKINPTIDRLESPQTAPLAMPRPDLPRLARRSAHPVTKPADLKHAIPGAREVDGAEIVALLPAVLENAGYRHGGIND